MHMFMASMGASPDHELLDVVDGVDVLHAVLHDLAGRFQALHSKAGKTPRLERHQGWKDTKEMGVNGTARGSIQRSGVSSKGSCIMNLHRGRCMGGLQGSFVGVLLVPFGATRGTGVPRLSVLWSVCTIMECASCTLCLPTSDTVLPCTSM